MRSLGRIFVVVVAIILVPVSCRRDEVEIIPRQTMSKIYAEMFLLDQQIHHQEGPMNRIADTTRVYEAVFNKYGFTYENFLASESKYLEDPKRFNRLLKRSANILKREMKVLKNEQALLEAVPDYENDSLFAKRYNSVLLDSVVSFPKLLDYIFLSGRDTLYRKDSLYVRDSLYVGGPLHVGDSLHAGDSLAVRDTLPVNDPLPSPEAASVNEVRVEKEKRDSLLKADSADFSRRLKKFDKMKKFQSAKD